MIGAPDPSSPMPLYHQIAEAIGYHIATGRLSPGEKLPSVRDSAKTLGVNMHTVRRAYAELAGQGLVETRGALGTRVLGPVDDRPRHKGVGKLERFLTRVLREAQQQHGLLPHDLAYLLTNLSAASPVEGDAVHVVECSESQCADHAREIESRWRVDARSWCLSRDGEPPPGPVVATYFHYNEIRRRWPHRFNEIRFAAIRPDPRVSSRLRPPATRAKRPTLTLCEYDESKALNIAADLSVLFPAERYRIEPRVVGQANELLAWSKTRTPVLFPPRLWDALTAEERNHARAIKVVYVFAPEDLEVMGQHFGWRRRHASRSAPI